MLMNETVLWLIPVVLAYVGIGLGLMYQGDALARPEQSKSIGRKMRYVGWVWTGLGVMWLIVIIVLMAINPE